MRSNSNGLTQTLPKSCVYESRREEVASRRETNTKNPSCIGVRHRHNSDNCWELTCVRQENGAGSMWKSSKWSLSQCRSFGSGTSRICGTRTQGRHADPTGPT